MNIGLIDADNKGYPNLALMKISAYHKDKGDHVEWWNGFKHYDAVYKSKVFTELYTNDIEYAINADKVYRGGSGYDLKNKLPYEIEHHYPDYGLYGVDDCAYGFITRGCPRRCKFCLVSEKEGNTHTVADLDEFWRGQKNIVLFDNNITASDECEKHFDALIKSGAYVDFSQGLDARLLTDKGCDQLNRMKIKTIHMAWDNYEFKTYECLKRIRPLLKYGRAKLVVYVLTNYNTTHEQDLERIYKLRDLEYDPYVMIYDKPHAPKVTRRLQRWCNAKWIIESCRDFNDYKG